MSVYMLAMGKINYFVESFWIINSPKGLVIFENQKEVYKWAFPKAAFALYLSWLTIYTWKMN